MSGERVVRDVEAACGAGGLEDHRRVVVVGACGVRPVLRREKGRPQFPTAVTVDAT